MSQSEAATTNSQASSITEVGPVEIVRHEQQGDQFGLIVRWPDGREAFLEIEETARKLLHSGEVSGIQFVIDGGGA